MRRICSWIPAKSAMPFYFIVSELFSLLSCFSIVDVFGLRSIEANAHAEACVRAARRLVIRCTSRVRACRIVAEASARPSACGGTRPVNHRNATVAAFPKGPAACSFVAKASGQMVDAIRHRGRTRLQRRDNIHLSNSPPRVSLHRCNDTPES